MVHWPAVALGVITLIRVVHDVIMTYHGAESSRQADYFSRAAVGLVVASWIEIDRRRQAISLPFEYTAFVFFLWPIVTPYYLIKTRGWKGVGVVSAFILIYFLLTLAASAVYRMLTQ